MCWNIKESPNYKININIVFIACLTKGSHISGPTDSCHDHWDLHDGVKSCVEMILFGAYHREEPQWASQTVVENVCLEP